MTQSNLPIISLDLLAQHRAQTYFTAPGKRLTNFEQAVRFVNERSFAMFWPVKGIEMPSLWTAAAGDRPVPDVHDDPGHITWDWKDKSLGKKKWYYGRVIKRRNAFIGMDMLPFFYALSPNYGEPEQDYLIQYEQGHLRPEAKWIFEALLKEGPLDTLALKKAARLSSPESEGRFNRGIDDLQMEFKINPIGIAPVGAWRYAFIYECTHRHFPELFSRVIELGIDEKIARVEVTKKYLLSTGAAPILQAGKIFGWQPAEAQRTIQELLVKNDVIRASHPSLDGEWVALPSLVS